MPPVPRDTNYFPPAEPEPVSSFEWEWVHDQADVWTWKAKVEGGYLYRIKTIDLMTGDTLVNVVFVPEVK